MSDNQRRTICRFGFLLLCLLPTVIIGYWIFHPQSSDDWSQMIRAHLAINTTIADVETPGPRVTILRDVEFKDPDGNPFFQATQVRVVRQAVNEVHIETPVQVSSHALAQMARQVNQHLIRSHTATRPWKIFLGKTVIIGDNPDVLVPRSLVAKNIQIDIVPESERTVASLSMQLIDDKTGNWITGGIEKWIGDAQTRQRIGLDTGTDSLPTWLLADLVPDLKRLGRNCQFNGVLEMENESSFASQNAFSGRLAGIFSQVDLSEMISPYDHQLSGICDANVSNCIIENGRIYQLTARSLCRSGSIGLPLLMSMTQKLGLLTQTDLADLVEFTEMDLQWEFKNGQLFQLHHSGGVGTERTGTIALDQLGNRLLVCTDDQPKPFEDFVDSLVNPDGNPELHDQKIGVLAYFHMPRHLRVAAGDDTSVRNRY